MWGFYIVVVGLKMYNLNQRIVMFAGFFCLIVAGLVLSTASHADFVTAYDGAVADADGSMFYEDTIAIVRDVEGVGI